MAHRDESKTHRQPLVPIKPSVIDELTAKLLRPRHPTNVGKVLRTFARDNHLSVRTLDQKAHHQKRQLETISEQKERTIKDIQLEEKLWAAQLKREERMRKELRAAAVRIQWQSFQ